MYNVCILDLALVYIILIPKNRSGGQIYRVIVDLLRYDNFVVCYTESYPQRIT